LSYDPALTTRVRVIVWLLVAGSVSAGALICRHGAGEKGLTLTVRSGADPTGTTRRRRVSTVDTRDLWAEAGHAPVRAQWDGLWRVPEAGSFALEARSDEALAQLMTNLAGHDIPNLLKAFESIDHERCIDPGSF